MVLNCKKLIFIKEQEGNFISSKLGIRTPFSKIPLLGDIMFKV